MSRGLAAGCLAAAAVALAGCAAVPDSGPVRVGRAVAPAGGGGLSDAIVREVPAGPQPGADPVQVVGGFLRAMVDSDGGYGVARSYLAPGAGWSAGAGITVYAEPTRVVREGQSTVVVQADRVGVLGAHGAYRVDPGTIRRRFEVSRRGGQWRIAKLDSGVLLSTDDANRVLQPAALYFLTPDGGRLVPQPVLESPQQPGLATTLMRGLVAGPGPLLAPGVRTAVPRGTTLLGNVPISADGVADIDLSAGARQISAPQLRRLSAQVVWTMRQLSSVTAVRLFANGSPLEAPGVPSLQPVSSWPQFDPAVPPPSRGALFVHDGQVIGLGVPEPDGLRRRRVVAVTRNNDGSVIAAVRDGRSHQLLLVGTVDGGFRTRLRATAISAPTFGPAASVVAATSTGAVYSVSPGGAPLRVSLAGRLARGVVRELSISREGTRVAAVVGTASGSELDIATVVSSGGRLSFREPRLILPASAAVAGVAWADADQIVTTVAGSGDRRGVLEISADGYRSRELSGSGLPSAVDQVAAAPGERVVAAGPAGSWELAGRRWRKLSAGAAPSYAGG
ncbi:MAG TPA: LpqB family beta-propeller domain-containing protein [Mycobacteriales bacterium]|nr:LpqB family beta-propeller domain-containing protein [Mycobacteriales bacterium]